MLLYVLIYMNQKKQIQRRFSIGLNTRDFHSVSRLLHLQPPQDSTRIHPCLVEANKITALKPSAKTKYNPDSPIPDFILTSSTPMAYDLGLDLTVYYWPWPMPGRVVATTGVCDLIPGLSGTLSPPTFYDAKERLELELHVPSEITMKDGTIVQLTYEKGFYFPDDLLVSAGAQREWNFQISVKLLPSTCEN